MASEHRQQVLGVVREGYAHARTIADRAGVTQADEDAAGPPAVAFGVMAATMYKAAGAKPGDGPDAMRHDADALAMLSELCRIDALTWADVRNEAVA